MDSATLREPQLAESKQAAVTCESKRLESGQRGCVQIPLQTAGCSVLLMCTAFACIDHAEVAFSSGSSFLPGLTRETTAMWLEQGRL